MIKLPPQITWSEVVERGRWGRVAAWATPSVRRHVAPLLPYPCLEPSATDLTQCDTLVVVGGGALIDRAKEAVRGVPHAVRLVAVASLWGSGAEASPVVVRTVADKKTFRLAAELLPDYRAYLPELAATLSCDLIRYACGDVWSHALEGYLSPLAAAELRRDLAKLIRQLSDLPIAYDSRWFEASATACAGQAASSVGLVHGMAHVLEPVLKLAFPDDHWGHARLCSLMLWPVMKFNAAHAPKWAEAWRETELDGDAIVGAVRGLYDEAAYARVLPHLLARWNSILRDPCTRTNCTLVRPQHSAYFEARQFA